MKSLRDYIKLLDKPRLFVDMDDTLVEWTGGANSVLKKYGYPEWDNSYWLNTYTKEEADEIRWAIVNKVSTFWENLKFSREGKKLWEFVKNYKPNILSACVQYSPRCRTGKKVWIQKNLGLINVGEIYLVERSDKKRYATTLGKPNILIDDYEKNLIEFKAAGGISIKMTTANDVIGQLKKIGFE